MQSDPITTVKLTGSQCKELKFVLMKVFETVFVLEEFVRFDLDINPETILRKPGTLTEIAYDLICWAQANNKVVELILKVREERPKHRELQEFAENLLHELDVSQWDSPSSPQSLEDLPTSVSGSSSFIPPFVDVDVLSIGGVNFKIVRPEIPEHVVPAIYGEPLLTRRAKWLQDHLIPYQEKRVGGSRIQEEIITLLDRRRRVLIKGPTGTGKTREAAEAACALCREGWTILIFCGGWLDQAWIWPHYELNRGRTLLFIDDIHTYCKTHGNHSNEKNIDLSFQRQLTRLIAYLSDALNEDKVMVLLTARSEPGYWNALQELKYQAFWNTFERIDFAKYPFTDEALIALFNKCVAELGLTLTVEDPLKFIVRTDRTPLTLVTSLRRAGRRGVPISPEDMTATSEIVWSDWYASISGNPEYPFLNEIYDAVNILNESKLPLTQSLIGMFINERLGGFFLAKWNRLQKINRTIQNLLNDHSGWWKRMDNGTLWVRLEVLEGKPDLASIFKQDKEHV